MYPCHQAMWMIKPGTVLRKRLKDFSVGHAFLLEAIESPFILGGNATLSDLATAVLICSLPFKKACQYLMSPLNKILRDVQRWAWWCSLWRLDLANEMDAFKTYISAYHDMPDAYRKRGQKRYRSALPESVRVAWCLMERMSEYDAWNCPMSRALTYFTAQAEYNGQEFVTEEEHKKVTNGDSHTKS